MEEQYKKYKVYENSLILLIETDEKVDAVIVMNNAHLRYPEKWHELLEFWDGQYNGIRQYKPGDLIRVE